jgi:hypothetical protein
VVVALAIQATFFATLDILVTSFAVMIARWAPVRPRTETPT